MPQCYVVQEDEGLGALGQDIVHAHGHGVDADGVVLVHCKCDLEFRTYTVGAAHQHGLLVTQ